jgi:hypothetical protein
MQKYMCLFYTKWHSIFEYLILNVISILFDFRMQIIQPGTVAMVPSAHGSQ